MDAICGEISTYASTVYGALEDYADALTSASWAYSQSLFTASQTYDTALSTADNAYSNTAYNAQKTATLAYYDAAISELTQSIDLESKQKADEAKYCNLLATTQAEVIDDLFEDLEEITPDDGDGITNWLGSLQTSGSTIGTVATTEQSARSGRNSANTTTLNDLKTTLAATRAKQEAAADRLYRNSEQGGWNAYLIGVQTANTTYLGSVKTSENTYKTASDAAERTFDISTVTAYTSFQETAKTLDTAFYAAVSDATDLTFTTTTYFTTTGANASYQNVTFTSLAQTKQTRYGSKSDKMIDRIGEPLATAHIRQGSTILQLAKEAGLNADEWKKWLTTPNNEVVLATGEIVAVDSLQKTDALAEQTFQVPNTIIALWGGNVGHFGRNFVDFDGDIQYAKSKGFYVMESRYRYTPQFAAQFGEASAASPVTIPVKPVTDENEPLGSRLLEYAKDFSSQKQLYGIMTWSHGWVYENKEENIQLWCWVFNDGTHVYMDEFQEAIQYQLGLVVIRACYAGRASSICSANGIFSGVGDNTILDPTYGYLSGVGARIVQFFSFKWDDLNTPVDGYKPLSEILP